MAIPPHPHLHLPSYARTLPHSTAARCILAYGAADSGVLQTMFGSADSPGFFYHTAGTLLSELSEVWASGMWMGAVPVVLHVYFESKVSYCMCPGLPFRTVIGGWMDGWMDGWMFCFVLFCEKRFGQGRTGPLPEITHLLFGCALPLPLYYPCPQKFSRLLELVLPKKTKQPATGLYRQVPFLLFLMSF